MKDNFCLEASAKTTGKNVSILAYSGGLMTVPGWGSVAIELSGLDISGQVKLLADHDNSLSGVVGYGKAKVQDGKLSITGKILESSEAGRQIIELAKDGLEFQASVGVESKGHKYVSAGESCQVNGKTIKSETGFILIERGRLREVTICSLGCDGDTKVQIAAQKIYSIQNKGICVMEKTQLKKIQAAIDSFSGVLTVEDRSQIERKALEADWSMEEVYSACTDRMKLKDLQAGRPSAPFVRDDGGSVNMSGREAKTALFLFKMGRGHVAEKHFKNERLLQAAADLSRLPFREILRQDAQQQNLASHTIEASFSTNSTATAFTSALQLAAMERFQSLGVSWPLIAKKRDVPNFLEHNLPRPYHKDGQLEEIGPNGELKHSQISDTNFTVRAKTKGKMFGITRTDIINDSIGFVADLVEDRAYEGMRSLHDDLYSVIKAATFFSENNGNYADGAVTALGIDGLAEALRLMRSQTGEDGRPIDVRPHLLLVPPSLEATARSIIASITVNRADAAGDNMPTANPWSSLNLKLHIEPRLAAAHGGSDTAWYLVADPAIVPAFNISFLDGKEYPTVEQNAAEFNLLGEQWRVFFDYGIDEAEHRSIVKMKGTI